MAIKFCEIADAINFDEAECYSFNQILCCIILYIYELNEKKNNKKNVSVKNRENLILKYYILITSRGQYFG